MQSNSNTMEMYQFIKNCKAQHLTIKDVKGLKPGDTLDVVIYDRNFEEYWIWANAEPDKAYKPEEFFAENRHTLVYLGDMKWTIKFPFGEEYEHPVHIDVSGLKTYWKWYAISEDGCIHITSEIVKEGEEIPEGWKEKHIHWTKFPETTRVGWRGPIMLWSKLKNMPDVMTS